MTFNSCPLVVYHWSVPKPLSRQPTWVETFQDHYNLTVLHGIHLISRKTHISTIKLKCSPFPRLLRLSCLALLLQAASNRLEGSNLAHAPLSRLWGSQETSNQPRNRITASLVTESQGMKGCFRQLFWADREGKETSLFSWEFSLKKRLLQCKFCSYVDCRGDLWTGWPCAASPEVMWKESSLIVFITETLAGKL